MSALEDSHYAILTEGLTKTFGTHNAVDGINLRVPRGAIFGFLGPNGSGKTTTIRMLLGLANIDSGSVRLLGEDVPAQIEKVLPKVGALVEGPAFYPYLSGRQNLMRFDSADRYADPTTRKERVEYALAKVGLTQAAEKKVHAYSLGMKQRLGIANALLQPRELLILDEPTNGLDPQGTREVRNLVRSLAQDGITIFISSHLLLEIEQICSHVAVMHRGSIVAQGSLAELAQSPTVMLNLATRDINQAISTLSAMGIDAQAHANQVTATISANTFAPEEIVKTLVTHGVGIQSFSLDTPTLEERFVSLTGEGFEVAR